MHSVNSVLKERYKTQNTKLYKRIRVPVKIIYKDIKMSMELDKYMIGFNGIIEAKSSYVTGRLLIIYDEEITEENEIEKHINDFTRKHTYEKQENIITLKNLYYNEEYSEPLTLEERKIISEDSTNQEKSIIDDWHAISAKKVKEILNTNLETGLGKNEIEMRRKDFGLNVLSEKKKSSLIGKFVENLKVFSTRLLIGVSVVSLFLGQIPDALAVLGVVILETALGAIQQYKSEKSMLSLKDVLVNKARVIRDGKEQVIDSKQIVPGDIILIEAGEKVPADARIIECCDLEITEASLTGESIPVHKDSEICDKYSELAGRSNMIYMGTNVMCGNGRAIVVNTGMRTEIGNIAAMLQNIKLEPTPLQLKMENFTNGITKLCVIACSIMGIGGIMAGKSIGQVLTDGVSFAIGALPESLPAVVTVAMALSVQRIARKNAIVRKLPSVETLGAANVICCDKTGTLTMNEMTVKKIYADKCIYEVSGSGYKPKGDIKLVEGEPDKRESLKELLTAGLLCNNAALVSSQGKWIIHGDPTEGAFITLAMKENLSKDQVNKKYKRLKEIPFDSSRKCMSVIVENDGDIRLYCKGAVDSIIDKCSTIYENGVERLFTATDKKRILDLCDEMSNSALRVLAIAYKHISSERITKECEENNMVFLGMAGMEDPPKTGVEKSIQKCHKAGIKVVMITGDHKNTAAAIGRQIGILTKGTVVTGKELDEMSEDELDAKIRDIQIFARTSPEQKLRIVKAFKRFGYTVAMTGDGVNDAPAIKESNIGIAMGRNGSDVAKDAAAITLVDDNFSTIVSAIEEGRAVSNNIKNSMKYLLAGSMGEILAIGLCSAFGGVLPLISMQIIWINLISESILGGCLAAEPCSEELMNYPPVKSYEPLINSENTKKIIKRGIGIGVSTFAVFKGSLMLGASMNKARTFAFSNLVCSQLVNMYDCRTNKRLLNNMYMNTASAASIAMLLLTIYIPQLNPFFGTEALGLLDWIGISGAAVLSRI